MDAPWVSNNRKPQLIVLPPIKEPNKTPRFTVPAGTHCYISRIKEGGDFHWRNHVTAKVLTFNQEEKKSWANWTFRFEGYLVCVPWERVLIFGQPPTKSPRA